MADDDTKKRTRELTRLRVKRFRQNKKDKSINKVEEVKPFVIQASTVEDYHDDDGMNTHWSNIYSSLESETVEVGIKLNDEHLLDVVQDIPAVGRGECDETLDYEEINNDYEWFDNDASADEDDVVIDSDEDFDEIEELRKWAASSNISHKTIEGLLGILRKKTFPQLPKTAKTFLKTCAAEYNIEDLDNSAQFVYFGLTDTLQRQINASLHPDDKIELLFNFDGLPLFKSSAKQFWPILCLVFHRSYAYKPFPVAIFAGDKKPNNLDHYLQQFVDEVNVLQRIGLIVEGKMIRASVKAIICDRPARSLIKCIKNHGAYYACERCVVKGRSQDRRIVYPATDSPLRTHESFCNQDNTEHHTGISPLLRLDNCDMINMFVLDFMHMGCLGNMKKLLLDYWLNSKSSAKLSFSAKSAVSEKLTSLKSQVPQEFQRTTRDLGEISKWKATEFRMFLLYTGPIVLRRYLPEEKYKHFLLLHTACRILCSDEFAVKCNDHAKLFLTAYVLDAAKLYGETSNVLNVHYLIHLADDAKYLKSSLSYFTAFPFESALGKIKLLLRSGNRPLAQVCRRLFETFFVNQERVQIEPDIKILRKTGVKEDGRIIIKRLRYKEATLASTEPNNTVILNNGDIMQIKQMYSRLSATTITVSGIILRKKKPLFTYPCSSELLCIWKVSRTATEITCQLTSISRKMVTFVIEGKRNDKIYALPLLHV